ncbi:redoxin domain-containing protein [Candidatus Atelocyanobacterium thalassae]
MSPDSKKSHIKLINKHNLSLELLSDYNHKVAKMYTV